jgi:hypothetical protein
MICHVMVAFWLKQSLQDLVDAAELLEVQTADVTGWYLGQEQSAGSDEVEIQSLHSYLYGIDSSSLISEMSQDKLCRQLSSGLRLCFRAHETLRRWVLSLLVDRNIGPSIRQKRMELLLDALAISRLSGRNRSLKTPDQPSVRSFAEAVLTSAMLSPESRAYYRTWNDIATTRGCSVGTLVSLLSRPDEQVSARIQPLTVDIGWYLERLIDAISMPNATEENGKPMINLEKRR